jgi:hypothetical protein
MRRSFILVILGIAVIFGVATWYRSSHQQANASTANSPAGRNDERRIRLSAIADALTSYVQATGKFPVAFPAAPTDICSGSSTNCKTVKLLDLTILLSKGYLAAMPIDPIGGHGAFNSGFTIAARPGGGAVLAAPRAEDGATITVNVN